MRTSLLLAAVLFASPAVAQSTTGSTTLTLADATTAPSGRVIVDGASWTCTGSDCVARGGANQTATRACRRVVREFGAVSAFTWKGETLSSDQIAACNA